MKKLLLSLFIISVALTGNVWGQSGSGTFASPYTGTISTDTTWSSGNVYVSGTFTIASGATLTISPGVTVAAVDPTTQIIIIGTMNAIGNATSPIRFTADADGNGSFGETGETWYGTFFQGYSYGTVNHCIFEYVNKPTNINSSGYGGAIILASSNVTTISNSTFRYNHAGFGAAIFVGYNTYQVANAQISNCIFHDNSTYWGGSALNFRGGNGATISNCLFYNNTANTAQVDAFGGSGVAGRNVMGVINSVGAAATTINNCTFVNNSTFNHTNYFLNYQICWNFDTNINNLTVNNSVFYSNANTTAFRANEVYTCTNCAATDAIPYGTNNITLSTDNGVANGPHFTNLANHDYSISFASPLRDAGTTPTPIVPTDILGNSRVGAYDIGAYEVQYSRWNGSSSTSWSTLANWDGGNIPGTTGTTGDVIIPNGSTNYPTVDPQNVSIGSGNIFLMESQAAATVGALTNTGTLTLESDDTGHSSSLIFGSYSGAGTTNIELHLTGGSVQSGGHRWHYISSPVTLLSTDLFTTEGTGPTQNLAQYDESTDDWLAYDGYSYELGYIPANPTTFNSLTPSKGYNYYYSSDHDFVISGSLNTESTYTSTLTNSGTGWNLLGNPYSAGLSWDAVISANSNLAGGSEDGLVNAGVYFSHDDIQYTYINGVSTGVGRNTTGLLSDEAIILTDENAGIIPPMQGFFVRYYGENDASFTIPASARSHGAPALYKGDGSDIPLIRLLLEDSEKRYDDAVVRFDEKAVAGLDRNYDGLKAFKKAESYLISTFYGDTEYSINGMPFPEEGRSFEIPVYLNLPTQGNFKISVSQLQNLDRYTFTLRDRYTGYSTELSSTSSNIQFTNNETGEINGRFMLLVSPKGNVPTGTENVAMSNELKLYHAYDKILITPGTPNWTSYDAQVKIFDITGRLVESYNGLSLEVNSTTEVDAPKTTGIYLVEIRTNSKRHVGKVVIK